jgi:uncharacterized BrkB/YihY/UPF0761 family membrane protein
MSSRLRKSILRIGGLLVLALGVLHLVVTPLISRLITENVSEATANWLTPPMLLNHVVVGILLLPLGFLTFYAAQPAVSGENWAILVTRVSAITLILLPAVLFFIMGTHYFSAIPFVIATIIVCAAALAVFAAAFWR